VLDPDSGVVYGLSADGHVVSIGWTRCGKIWFCPQCSSAVRQARSEEVTTAALRWLAAGGTLAAVVLTARHNVTHALGDLSDALWGEPMVDADGRVVLDRSGKPRRVPGAYQAMLTDPDWYGRVEATWTWTRKRTGETMTKTRPAEPGIRHRIGYAGMVRASEVTRSFGSGWHPHMNLLVFLGGTLDGTPAKGRVTGHAPVDPAEVDAWELWLRGMWSRTLERMDPTIRPSDTCAIPDCKCRGRGHGVMLKLITSPDDKALIQYLTKVQDGPMPDQWKDVPTTVGRDVDAARGAAMETVLASNKRGRTRQSMTPFQMLYRLYDVQVSRMALADAEGYGTVAECRAWWAEYETAMAGRRAIEWTRGLRGHVGITGDDKESTDIEYAYRAGLRAPLVKGVILTPDAARVVVRADVEMDVETCVSDDCLDSVADLVEAHGGHHDHVTIVGAAELAERQADQATRMRVRREQRELQARIDAYAIRPTDDDDQGDTVDVDVDQGDTVDVDQGEEYREYRRAASAARVDELTAALDRFRTPTDVVMRVSLTKPLRVAESTAPVATPDPAMWSATCRRCDGTLAPALRPYGQHVGDCVGH